MLANNRITAGRQLFHFSVPGLDGVRLALPLTRVAEVTLLQASTPVPFAPTFIQGLADWRGEVVTLINLAHALNPRDKSLKEPAGAAVKRHLVVRLALGDTVEGVAWSILPQAGTVGAPAQARSAQPAVTLAPELARMTVDVGEDTLTLLDLDGFAAYIQDFQRLTANSH